MKKIKKKRSEENFYVKNAILYSHVFVRQICLYLLVIWTDFALVRVLLHTLSFVLLFGLG